MLEVIVVESPRVGLVGSSRLLLDECLRLPHCRNPRLMVAFVELNLGRLTVSRWNSLLDRLLSGS